jgi:hypothetical protein
VSAANASPPKKRAYGADLVIPVLAVAFTIYFLTSIAGLEWEAKANGLFVGWLLIVLVVVQAVRTGIGYAKGRGDFSFAPLLQPREALKKRLGMMAITIAFVATVPWLGLGLGLFLALAAGFAVMGVHGRRHIALVALIAAVVCTVMFNAVLDTGLPKGPVEKLILHFLG